MDTFSSEWQEAALAEVAAIVRDVVEPTRIASGTRYVGLEHLDGDGNFLNISEVASGDLASAKFRFDPDHILYGKLRPYLRKIARPDFNGICSTDILPIKPVSRQVSRDYLYHYLRLPQMVNLANTRTTGANLPRLSPTTLAEFPVRFPPLDEQRRIAAILDKADAIRRRRRQALAEIDNLLRATFLDMFGMPDPAASDGELLGSVAGFVGGGSLPAGSPFDGQEDGLLLLKVGDLSLSGNEQLVRCAREWLPAKPRGASLAPAGSVVFPKRGGAIATDKKRLLKRAALLDPNLMAVYPLDKGVSSEFLFWWFQQFHLSSISSGSAVPQLNIKDLAPLKISEADPVKTMRFSEICQRAERGTANFAAATRAVEELFGTLSQRAFRGEL